MQLSFPQRELWKHWNQTCQIWYETNLGIAAATFTPRSGKYLAIIRGKPKKSDRNLLQGQFAQETHLKLPRAEPATNSYKQWRSETLRYIWQTQHAGFRIFMGVLAKITYVNGIIINLWMSSALPYTLKHTSLNLSLCESLREFR